MTETFDPALTGLIRREEKRFCPGGSVEVIVEWAWQPGFGPSSSAPVFQLSREPSKAGNDVPVAKPLAT